MINSHESPTAEFTRNPDAEVPGAAMQEALVEAVGSGRIHFIDATRLATRLLGDSIGSNLFMLGYAYQKGLVPVSAEAIEQAIGLNAVAVESNRQAFLWGRRAAHDPAAVERLVEPDGMNAPHCGSLDELINHRVGLLRDYQNPAYAERYRALVERVRAVDQGPQQALTTAVARYYFKLLTYKDEYEVARLYSDAAFLQQLEVQFEGDYRLQFHLAPSWLSRPDPRTGEPRKHRFGPWMLSAFGMLAKFRFLRGSLLDPFGHSAERRLERELIADYEADIGHLLGVLNDGNYRAAVAIAELPEQIRGYGHVKQRALEQAGREKRRLLAQLQAGDVQVLDLYEPAA